MIQIHIHVAIRPTPRATPVRIEGRRGVDPDAPICSCIDIHYVFVAPGATNRAELTERTDVTCVLTAERRSAPCRRSPPTTSADVAPWRLAGPWCHDRGRQGTSGATISGGSPVTNNGDPPALLMEGRESETVIPRWGHPYSGRAAHLLTPRVVYRGRHWAPRRSANGAVRGPESLRRPPETFRPPPEAFRRPPERFRRVPESFRSPPERF